MNIIIKKSILLLAVFVLFGFGSNVQAQNVSEDGDIEIDVQYGSGNNLGDDIDGDALFDEDNIYPGWSESKKVIVVNKSEEYVTELYIEFNLDDGNTLADELKIYVIRVEDDSYRVGGVGDHYTLEEIDAEGALYIDKLEPEENELYEVKLKFDEGAGNETQGKSTQFDIDFALGGIQTEGESENAILAAQGRNEWTGDAPVDEIDGGKTEELISGATVIEVGDNYNESGNGKIKGASTCRSWPLLVWIIITVIYGIIAMLIGKGVTTFQEKKIALFWQMLLLVGVIVVWYFFDVCRYYYWMPIISIIGGVIIAIIIGKKEINKTSQQIL